MYKLMLLAFALACDAGEQPAQTPTPEPPAAEAPAPEAPVADDAAEAAQGDSGEAAVNTEDGGGAAANAEEADHAGLAKADAADGAVDHVVTQCAGCGLAMAGDAAHSIEAHGYTLHMCSASCKANYESDLEGNLAQLAQ